jgi:hypothetical protein
MKPRGSVRRPTGVDRFQCKLWQSILAGVEHIDQLYLLLMGEKTASNILIETLIDWGVEPV